MGFSAAAAMTLTAFFCRPRLEAFIYAQFGDGSAPPQRSVVSAKKKKDDSEASAQPEAEEPQVLKTSRGGGNAKQRGLSAKKRRGQARDHGAEPSQPTKGLGAKAGPNQAATPDAVVRGASATTWSRAWEALHAADEAFVAYLKGDSDAHELDTPQPAS